MTPWLEPARHVIEMMLAALALLLALTLAGLIVWRIVDEVRWLRRRRLVARYQPLIDALLAPAADPDAARCLRDTPRRHRVVIGSLILAPLRLTAGDLVPRLRQATRELGLIEAWTESLGDRGWWRRAESVRALGLVREPSCTDQLLAALDDAHEEVRAAAADALGRIGDPRCATALLGRLPDESRHQRVRLIEAIRSLGPSVAPVLVEHARDHPADTVLTLDAIGMIGGATALDSLLAWSGAEDPAVRRAALRAIGSIGLDDRSYFYALRGLDDADPGVRAMAARALGRSGRHAGVPYLAAHLDDEWIVAAHCATGLQHLGPPGASALEARAASSGQGAELARQMLWELMSRAA